MTKKTRSVIRAPRRKISSLTMAWESIPISSFNGDWLAFSFSCRFWLAFRWHFTGKLAALVISAIKLEPMRWLRSETWDSPSLSVPKRTLFGTTMTATEVYLCTSICLSSVKERQSSPMWSTVASFSPLPYPSVMITRSQRATQTMSRANICNFSIIGWTKKLSSR